MTYKYDKRKSEIYQQWKAEQPKANLGEGFLWLLLLLPAILMVLRTFSLIADGGGR